MAIKWSHGWQQRLHTIHGRRHTHTHTHTHTNQNLHLCKHKGQNSMYVGNRHVSLCSQYGAWKPKCTVLHFLFCLCMLAVMIWVSVTALVRWHGPNNVARILWRGVTVRQKRRRTWWLHQTVHLHVTHITKYLDTLLNEELWPAEWQKMYKFCRYCTLVRKRYSSLLGIELVSSFCWRSRPPSHIHARHACAGAPMIECGSAPRLAARAGYDRWAEPPLINNALVALLHNPRPLVPFAGSSRARRVVTVGPAHFVGSSVTSVTNNRVWWCNSRSGSAACPRTSLYPQKGFEPPWEF